MKVNYKKKCFTTVDDIEKQVNLEWDKKVDRVYEEVKKDVAVQLMAVCMVELSKEFGFGKKRLNRFYRGVNCLFKMMVDGGLYGKKSTPDDCINLMRNKYGIDLDGK